MSPLLGAALVLGGLIILFIVCFLLNRKTPVPEGCEDLNAECETCPIHSCLKNKNKEDQ